MADLNRYSSSMFENTIVPEQSTFGETLGASLGLRYAPMFERALIGARFANQERDPNFDWKENLGNYSMYATSLYRAKNAEHMAELKSVIDRSTDRRQVLYNSTFMQELKAGLFDPVNYIALPLGGPSIGVVGSALRVGAGTAIIEGAAETINLQLDPVKTLEEAAMTTAGGFIFGAGFGALAGAGRGVGQSVRATAFKRTNEANEEIFQAVTRAEYLEGMTPDDIKNAPVREERPLGKLTDLQINERIQNYEGGEEALPLKNELGLRKIEELGIDIDDVYNLKSSWFTKSPLYKMVSTPIKRTLQSDASLFVKETTLKSFGDNGITLVLNSLGLPTPQSVAVRTAVHAGRWVKANDEMLKLWAIDTGASSASRLDINLSDTTRKLSRSDQTYRQWLTNVSEKRLRGVTDMSENEFQASQIINRYFKNSEARLESVGLINSAKGIKRQIEMLEVEVANLKADLSKAPSRESRQYLIIEQRLKKIESRKNLAEDKLAGFIDNSGVDPEPFFPRFFDAKIIKRRRQEFEGILIKWFEENPHIYRSDDKLSGKVVKVELSTNEKDIRDRARKTIRKILNEKDPYDLENISFGMTKSKHFRTRGLDIPNNLVTDFMMKDPLAVMKTYAARIEPRYEYAKMFGKDVDGVRFDLRMDMIREGRSEAYINKIMRDYNHMYDRTVGAVLENPDSLSQKAATIMREAASFSYMGSSGLAAIPDFGRIVMEYDMENVWKGVQALVDKERLNMTVDEARKAGEAIDILKGSAHMRMYEDMSNSIDANDVLSQTRNAFYILNGLAPLTTLAKQLAGVIDAHQIIEYSIKLGKGQLDDQSTEWLARYGIGKDMAAKIAEMPWQKTEFGLYMANTDEWVGDAIVDSLARKGFKYKFPRQNLSKLSDKKLTSHFEKEFEGANIYTDPKIVKPYFERVKREEGFGNILGYFVDFRNIGGRGPSQGFAVHIDKEAVKARFDSIKSDPRSGDQILKDAKVAVDEEKLSKEMFAHLKNEIEAADLFEEADDYFEYILMHELQHSVIRKGVNETIESYENRIDKAAINYIRNKQEQGKQNALELRKQKVLEEQEEVVMQFRAALNSGILNTIMSGTPADKPIITDGVVYIPMNVASKFGMKEHSKFKGYARIENGLMGLPFQFYSFVFANVNKTVGALAQGQIKNRAIGSATMMGLAYMSLSYRTPDYIWEDMSMQDRFVRSFDMSGIMALYSDIFYTAMHTSLALGGPNITGGLISPKYKQEPSVADALTGLAGAGPSWTYDTAKGIVNFASGNYGEGGKDIARNLPFGRMWFWKDEVNQITNAWAN